MVKTSNNNCFKLDYFNFKKNFQKMKKFLTFKWNKKKILFSLIFVKYVHIKIMRIENSDVFSPKSGTDRTEVGGGGNEAEVDTILKNTSKTYTISTNQISTS